MTSAVLYAMICLGQPTCRVEPVASFRSVEECYTALEYLRQRDPLIPAECREGN